MVPLGEHTWWHPVIVYFTAPFLMALPLSETLVRFPSVIIAALNAVLLFWIGRRLWADSRPALLAGLLMIVTPAHFIQGRIAMDYIYPVPFVLGWVLCLLVFLEHRRPWQLFLGTSLLGFGVYSYLASVVMMPLYLVMTFVILVVATDRPVRSSGIAAAGFLWPLVILAAWLVWHPGVIAGTLARYPGAAQLLTTSGASALAPAAEAARGPSFLSLIPGRLSLYWQFFDPSFLFVWGGYASALNSTRHAGVFPLPFLVLVPLGLFRAARQRDLRSVLVAVAFLTAPTAAVLATPEPYAIDREMELIPFGVLLAVEGLRWLRVSHATWVRQAATVLLVATPLHFALFMADYYTDYRLRSSMWFGLNKRGAAEAAIASDAIRPAPAVYLSTSADPYLESYWRFAAIKLGREDLLARTHVIPGPDIDLEHAPSGSVFIVNKDDAALPELMRHPDLETRTDIPEIGEVQQYLGLKAALNLT